MKIQIVVRPGTLAALAEHSAADHLDGAERLDNSRSLVKVDEDTLAMLIDRIQPGDKSIDDVLLRISR